MIIVSFIPLILYLIVLKSLDSFRIVHWLRLLWCVMSGCLSCGLAWGLNELCLSAGLPFYAPLIEEILKGIVALVMLQVFRIAFFAEALCYGAAIGAGFSLLENAIYIYYSPDMGFPTLLFRGLGTSMLHIGCTSLFMVLWLLAKHNKTNAFLRLWGLIPCVAIHALHNLQLLPPLFQLVAVVVLFLLVFLYVNRYNERCIERWLDISMMYDVTLLSAIQEGSLPDTKAGQYLMSVKEQFDSFVFLDMICYVQLYLELTISYKSRMMLVESGLAQEESDEEKDTQRARMTEFATLRNNIGKMGELILKPIVRMTAEDKKILGIR